MQITNANYVIQNISICPGSNNDRYIWNNSEMKDYLESLSNDPNEQPYYLLGKKKS